MKKIKKILKRTVKFALVVCFILVAMLVVCGLPLRDIKEKLKNKMENV